MVTMKVQETKVPLKKVIRSIEHFSGLSDQEASLLFSASSLKDYDAGASILDQNQSQAIYSFLVKGRWGMRRHIVGVAEPRVWIDDRPGNWHGGIALIDKVAPPEVWADTDCTVLHVPRDLLDDIAAGNGHLAHAMLRGVSGGSTMLYEHTKGKFE